MSSFQIASGVRIVLPRAALEAVFDECDRYDEDETGGRVLGTYEKLNELLTIRVSAILDPGPGARRTNTSLFQDGEYHERIFRKIERQYPSIEHLGTWHTHHVNGFPTLSGGDISTYHRIVNHRDHNTDFLYALLVVDRHKISRSHSSSRYSVKHYLLLRGDSNVYEIRPTDIEITDDSLTWTNSRAIADSTVSSSRAVMPPANMASNELVPKSRVERVYDKEMLADTYPSIRPYTSPRLGLYWRGMIALLDGSNVEIVVVESIAAGSVNYTATLRSAPSPLSEVLERIQSQEFPSARAAIFATERLCNRALYNQLRERQHNDRS